MIYLFPILFLFLKPPITLYRIRDLYHFLLLLISSYTAFYTFPNNIIHPHPPIHPPTNPTHPSTLPTNLFNPQVNPKESPSPHYTILPILHILQPFLQTHSTLNSTPNSVLHLTTISYQSYTPSILNSTPKRVLHLTTPFYQSYRLLQPSIQSQIVSFQPHYILIVFHHLAHAPQIDHYHPQHTRPSSHSLSIR